MLADLILSKLAQPLLAILGRATGVDLGSASDFLSIANALGSTRLERRRIARRLDDAADTVAERLESLIAGEFSNLSDGDRTAAILALGDSLREVAPRTTSEFLEVVRDPLRFQEAVLDAGGTSRRRALYSAAAEQIFDRLLDELSTYLVEIAVSIGDFTPQALALLLREQERFSALVTQALEQLPARIAADQVGDRDATTFLAHYRESMARRYDFLEILGVDLENVRKRYELSTAYVSLNLRPQDRRDVPSLGDGDVSVEDLLIASDRVLLVGDPGAGKTTILKWIALAAVRGRFGGDLRDLNSRIPFIVKLRSLNPGQVPDLDRLVGDSGVSAKAVMPEGWVHTVLSSAKGIVLVDGLDEISADFRIRIYDWLADLLALYPGNMVVVTTRPAALRETPMQVGAFTSAYVLPMSLHQVNSFIDYWHSSVIDTARLPADDLTPGERADALRSRLLGDRELRLMATSPLLCAVICALNIARRGDLPSRRRDVYGQTLDMLLKRRESERQLETSPLSAQEKAALLQELAQWLVLMGKSEIPLKDAVALFENVLRLLAPQHDLTGRAVLDDFVARTGVLRLPTDKTVEFTHRTFQEFLAAQKIVEDRQRPELSRHVLDAEWQQVVVWSVGFMGQADALDFTTELLDKVDSAVGEDRTRLILLALACRESALYMSPEHRERIAALGGDVVPPRSLDTVGALAAVGDAAVPLLAGALRPDLDQDALELSCDTLFRIAGGDALAALSGLQPELKTRLAKRLISGWALFEAEPYADAVLSRVPTPAVDTERTQVLLRDASLLPHTGRVAHAYSVSAEVPAAALDGVDAASLVLRMLKLNRPPRGWSLKALAGLKVDSLIISGAEHIVVPEPRDDFEPLDFDAGEDDDDGSPLRTDDGEYLLRAARVRVEAARDGCEFSTWPFAQVFALRELELVDSIEIRDGSPGTGVLRSMRVSNSSGECWRRAWSGQMKRLELHDWAGPDLEPLSELDWLEELHVPDSDSLQSLRGIEGLSSLRLIDVSGGESLADGEALRSLDRLETVNVTDCRGFSDRQLVADLSQHCEVLADGSAATGGRDVEPDLLLEEERWRTVDLERQEDEELAQRHWSYLELESDEWIEDYGDLWAEPVEFSEADAARRGFVIVEDLEAWRHELDDKTTDGRQEMLPD